jgi:hypothetical protein
MRVSAIKMCLDCLVALDRVRDAAGYLAAPFEEIEISADIAASFLSAIANLDLCHPHSPDVRRSDQPNRQHDRDDDDSDQRESCSVRFPG